jgi:hypothetical protein
MQKPRKSMTVRRVKRGSAAEGEAHVGGSIDERLALVGVLSIAAWANSGRPLPEYARHEMPIRRTTLTARSDRD